MKQTLIAVILSFFILPGCVKAIAEEEKKLLNPAVFHNRGLGASARELLSAEEFSSLTVEIQYMQGYRPDTETIRNLEKFMHTYLQKPSGIHIKLEEIKSISNKTVSKVEAAELEDTYRKEFVSGKNISVYFLVTNGTHPDRKILGMAYKNTSAILYGKSIHDNSSINGRLSRAELQTAVLLHELGHMLGLVNKAGKMEVSHEDIHNPYHCNNPKCVMYFETETRNLSPVLRKGNIPELDAACIADLQANGGKNEFIHNY
jgi:hypothetical protein